MESISRSIYECRICGDKYNQGPTDDDPTDRRPTFMPGPCGLSICMSCAEMYRASEIEELEPRRKSIRCMFCNDRFHSEHHVFHPNRDLMEALQLVQKLCPGKSAATAASANVDTDHTSTFISGEVNEKVATSNGPSSNQQNVTRSSDLPAERHRYEALYSRIQMMKEKAAAQRSGLTPYPDSSESESGSSSSEGSGDESDYHPEDISDDDCADGTSTTGFIGQRGYPLLRRGEVEQSSGNEPRSDPYRTYPPSHPYHPYYFGAPPPPPMMGNGYGPGTHPIYAPLPPYRSPPPGHYSVPPPPPPLAAASCPQRSPAPSCKFGPEPDDSVGHDGSKNKAAAARRRSKKGAPRTMSKKGHKRKKGKQEEGSRTKKRNHSTANSDDDDSPPKPKRPMTAYNFFFRDYRNKMKNMGLDNYNKMIDGKPYRQESDPTKVLDERFTRRQQEMGKAIGRRWREITKAELAKYQKLAAAESLRYKREMRYYADKGKDLWEQKGKIASTRGEAVQVQQPAQPAQQQPTLTLTPTQPINAQLLAQQQQVAEAQQQSLLQQGQVRLQAHLSSMSAASSVAAVQPPPPSPASTAATAVKPYHDHSHDDVTPLILPNIVPSLTGSRKKPSIAAKATSVSSVPRKSKSSRKAASKATTDGGASSSSGVIDTLPFPHKLHILLSQIETDSLSHVIGWQPHGRSFKIRNSQEFATQILEKYFNTNKVPSFQRQLNLYGFTRIMRGPDRGGYYHEYFLKGKPELTTNIQRTRIGTGARQASNPDAEPNFYTMEPLEGTTEEGNGDDEGATGGAVKASIASKHNTPMADTITPPSQCTNIQTPHRNDVLCGRGGRTINHIGNRNFRILVREKKVRDRYHSSPKLEKRAVSRTIVEAVRGLNPPGRFLKKDDRTGLWFDIGDQNALEKTSQALRERAPITSMKKMMKHNHMTGEGADESKRAREGECNKDIRAQSDMKTQLSTCHSHSNAVLTGNSAIDLCISSEDRGDASHSYTEDMLDNDSSAIHDIPNIKGNSEIKGENGDDKGLNGDNSTLGGHSIEGKTDIDESFPSTIKEYTVTFYNHFLGFVVGTKNGKAYVQRVVPGSDASLSNIKVGDFLVDVDGQPVISKSHVEVARLIADHKNRPLDIRFIRHDASSRGVLSQIADSVECIGMMEAQKVKQEDDSDTNNLEREKPKSFTAHTLISPPKSPLGIH